MLRERHQIWRSEAGGRLWLSMLVAAMEDASRPERRPERVETATLDRLRAQLALPASFRRYEAAASHLRH